MFERFTEKAIKVIMLAQEEARRLGHNFVGTEQILLGLVGEGRGIAAKVLKRDMGVKLQHVRREVENIIGRGSGFVAVEIPFTPRTKRMLELSLEESRQLGHNYIGTEHILLGMLREGEGVGPKVLEILKIDKHEVRRRIMHVLGEGPDSSNTNGRRPRSKTPILDGYGANLTLKAAGSSIDPVVGRANEIERVIQILGRRRKNNPILIGEPGVGKTAVAEGFALRIINNDIPEELEGTSVHTLDIGLLVAGTKYRGEFEERLRQVMQELRNVEKSVLVIDEVHTLVGAGAAEGAIDAANILKPALARGELQCIGATTLEEFRKYIEKDAALERRFQPVMVGEPSVEEAIEILLGLRERYEKHHKLVISDEAVVAAASFSDQYISDRFLPDKAIDLIDEAGSRVRLMNSKLPMAAKELDQELQKILKSKAAAVRSQDYRKAEEFHDQEMEIRVKINAIAMNTEGTTRDNSKTPVVSEEDIAGIVAAWTGIPVNKVTKSESQKLLQMEETLHGRIIGQDEAVVAVTRAIKRARVGLKNPNRPIASFLFSGPTGVGKTELTKALATYFFGSEDAMIRLDMSEFMERHTVSKLIGSPPGYVGYSDGGQLTEAVRRRPYTVVLFDEIEKGHPDVFNLMLQIFEDGHLTDSKGRKVDFKNTLLVMTSNVGAKSITKIATDYLGFELEFAASLDTSLYNRMKKLVGEELKEYFRPEFLNRLDEIIVFRMLNKDEVSQIADIMLNQLFVRIKTKGIELDVTDRFKIHLVDRGYDPNYGARPLRRAVTKLMEDSLSHEILTERLKPGDTAIMDIDLNERVIILRGERFEWEDFEVKRESIPLFKNLPAKDTDEPTTDWLYVEK
jgi:ATP-dependent Clp protease ATP-binding subunit ClpC